MNESGRVLAVNISGGGIPKLPVDEALATPMGLEGDGRDHAKHWKPERALSIQDEELIEELRGEGYAVRAGTMGENLTVRDLCVQGMEEGTRLRFSGGIEIELTGPRKPCFVLDAIAPDLKDEVVGRLGQMARVLVTGTVRPGETITVSAPVGDGPVAR